MLLKNDIQVIDRTSSDEQKHIQELSTMYSDCTRTNMCVDLYVKMKISNVMDRIREPRENIREDRCHMWLDGSATRPREWRERKKSNCAPFLVSVQYQPRSTTHTHDCSCSFERVHVEQTEYQT